MSASTDTTQTRTIPPKPYVPLDLGYYDDAKIIEAGEAAELLFVRALACAKRLWSDGVLLDAHLQRIGLSDVQERAERLVDVGLWVQVEGGFQIVNWHRWNLTAEQAQDRLERKRQGGVLGNHKRWHKDTSDPDCTFCLEEDKTRQEASPSTDRSTDRSTYRSSDRNAKPNEPSCVVPRSEIEQQERTLAQMERSARVTPEEIAAARDELDAMMARQAV